MEKPISYVCPITHNRWGGDLESPEDEVEFKFEVMPDIQAKLDSGLCLLMEIAEPENLGDSQEVTQIDANKAERTGRMAFVSQNTIEHLFGPGHDEVKTAFVNKEIMDGLELMSAKMAEAQSKLVPDEIANAFDYVMEVPEDDSIDFEELDNE